MLYDNIYSDTVLSLYALTPPLKEMSVCLRAVSSRSVMTTVVDRHTDSEVLCCHVVRLRAVSDTVERVMHFVMTQLVC